MADPEMTRESDAGAWRVQTIRAGSGTISHSVIATAPTCPDSRHPTRHCDCRVFRRRADAEAYIAEAEAATS